MKKSVKDVMIRAGGVLNEVTGSAVIVMGTAMGLFMILYGRKLQRKTKES